MPVSPVLTDCLYPVPVFRAVTVTAGIGAPEGSVTAPEISPVIAPACPKHAGMDAIMATKMMVRNRYFMLTSQSELLYPKAFSVIVPGRPDGASVHAFTRGTLAKFW